MKVGGVKIEILQVWFEKEVVKGGGGSDRNVRLVKVNVKVEIFKCLRSVARDDVKIVEDVFSRINAGREAVPEYCVIKKYRWR